MVRNQNFGFSKNRQKSCQIFGDFGQKKLSPKASENRQNGDKSPHLVTLVIELTDSTQQGFVICFRQN